MPAPSNKQRLLNQMLTTLPKQMALKGELNGKADTLPVLEQFIYALCREATTKAEADRAFRRLREEFFDWNEIRVSSVREIAEVLDNVSQPEARAQKIIDFLQEVFELNYSFDLESLHKKGLKVAAKQLSRYQAADEYNTSWVVQRSLGGHAIPLDKPTLRVIRRLGLVDDPQADTEAVRSSLEHQIPKAKGALFVDIANSLAADFCKQAPLCDRCPIANQCPKNLDEEPAPVASNVAS